MKKIIMTAAAVFALTFVNAQTENMKFGIKTGMNMASLAGGEGDIDPSMKAGVQIGGFGEFKMSEKFALQPELLFSTQGAKYKDSSVESGVSYSGEEKVKLSYLNIPVMAKYFVSEKFSLEAGPQIGFLLSAKDEYEFTATDEFGTMKESGEEDIKDGVNSTDFGFNLGAGYDFTKNISAGLRYTMGLSGLEKDAPAGFSTNKNSVFQLSVGYSF